jgi:CitB family two-component system response regulator MalR
MVAELNRRYLERVEGFVLVAMAKTVQEALSILGEQDIDLILLDIFMPGINGLELLTTIRERDHDVDVIVVSAASDKQTIKKALRFGAVDYLVKPFEFERFSKAVSDYRDGTIFMRQQAVINQVDLDKRILHREQAEMGALPKGIDRNTLKTVLQTLQGMGIKVFTTEEMASRIGISRVSMRKYLYLLRQWEIIDMEVTYGSIGRPVYRFFCTSQSPEALKRYM